MQQRCTCKREIIGWYFNFDEDSPTFIRNDKIGTELLTILLKLKQITKTTTSIAKMLLNIETKQEMRSWFLSLVKSYTKRQCYGWQCKMKVIKINKNCAIHKHQLGKI